MLFINPAKGRLTSPFGWRIHPISKKRAMHWGIDIGSHADNTIVAAAAGKVRLVVTNNPKNGYGHYLIITHSNGYETLYAHLKSVAVKTGQTVGKGQYIGIKGTTGASTGVHLHFEVHTAKWNNRWSNAVDPVGYVNDPSLALKVGIKGPRVGDLQRNLNAVGYKLTVDNSFGAATDKAVRDLQRKNKLVVDGSVGPATFESLNKVQTISKPKANLTVDGYLGRLTIQALQRYFGTPVDGVISRPSTMVKALQKLLGVKQDGYWGAITTRALQKCFGTPQDGVISKPSTMIKELQRRLNGGKL